MEARADARLSAARELAKWSLRKFSGKAAVRGGEALTRRIVSASARYGDDIVRVAVRKAGPQARQQLRATRLRKHAPRVRFVGKYGDEVRHCLPSGVLSDPLGDDAAAMLAKHKGIAEPLLEGFGNTATRALAKLSPRNGRRLAMLQTNLLRIHKAKRLVEIIGKYGDPAMDWVWKHKAPLAASAAMAAFLANPEPFLNGTRQLGETVSKSLVVPVTNTVIEGGAKIAESVVSGTVKPIVTERLGAAKGIPGGRFAAGVSQPSA